jgi:hypothetical protein
MSSSMSVDNHRFAKSGFMLFRPVRSSHPHPRAQARQKTAEYRTPNIEH